MSRKISYRCDGCDTVSEAPVEKSTPPQGFSLDVEVAVNGVIAKYDLCKSCLTKLYEQANPTQWTRATARVPSLAAVKETANV